MNSVTLVGRLARDPDLRHIGDRAVCNFTLAVDKRLSKEKRAEFEQSGKYTADFIRIVVWGRQAENCSKYLKKGNRCGVLGRITTSSYKDASGNNRYSTDVVADQVEFLESLNSNSQGSYQPQSSGFGDSGDSFRHASQSRGGGSPNPSSSSNLIDDISDDYNDFENVDGADVFESSVDPF